VRTVAGWASLLGYTTGWRLVRMLPHQLTRTMFSLGADFATRRGGRGVRQLRENLSRVVPQADTAELDELTRRAMRSYARYWQEVFRLPAMDHREIRAETTVSGAEYLDAALEEGNGAVLALPHTGNWDVAGIWAVGHVGTFSTVAERLEPESLYRRFVSYRESLGFEVVGYGTGTGSYRPLFRRLRGNGAVCLIADRELSAAGVEVNFFGAPARFPAGPARLAASTGAALLPVGCWYTDAGWGLRIHPRIRVNSRAEIPAATQALADVFAGDIAAHPADWHMMQQVWGRTSSDETSGVTGEVG